MIYLLFGDNIVESRKKLSEFTEQNYPDFEIVKSGECGSEAEFDETLRTESMFLSKKLVIFENFFKGRAPKWKAEINFNSRERDGNIFVFWESGEINIVGKNLAKILPKTAVFEFKLPNLLWSFLDGIQCADRPGGLSLRINNLRQVLRTVDANYLFLMMVRQFRLLILIKEKYRDYPSEFKRLTFQKYKLASQAAGFSLEKLKKEYNNLLLIEERAKTGTGIYDLKTEIEKFLINL